MALRAARMWLLIILALAPSPIAIGAEDDNWPTVKISGKVLDGDRKPVANAVVTSLGDRIGANPRKDNTAISSEDGRFSLKVRKGAPRAFFTSLTAIATDGRMAYFAVSMPEFNPIDVLLKKPRDLNILVQDGAGEPVADAQVEILAGGWTFASGRTGHDGRASFRVPADTWDLSFFAFKSKVGFDYILSQRLGENSLKQPLPDQLTLKLD